MRVASRQPPQGDCMNVYGMIRDGKILRTSFRRKPESRFCSIEWVPAFAGTTVFLGKEGFSELRKYGFGIHAIALRT